MIAIIKRHWPAIVAVMVLWATIAVLLISSIHGNKRHFTYASDDAYIHMAIAKHLVQHGIWGITRYEFSSSSSSPFWTLLLSFFYLLFGVNEFIPLILNIVSATLIICLIYGIFKKYEIINSFSIVVLLSVIFFTPLPSILFCGLEHALHILISVYFIYLASKVLSKSSLKDAFNKKLLLALSPFVTTVRYEGIFLVFVVCILFVIRRRFLFSFFLCSLALVPLVIYGLISIHNGWFFLPNSVLLKGNKPDALSLDAIVQYFYSGYYKLRENSHIFNLVFLSAIVFYFRYNKIRRIWDGPIIMIIIFLIAAFLHMLAAQTGWFYRYEAYLVVLGIVIIIVGIFGDFYGEIIMKGDNNLILNFMKSFFILIIFFPIIQRGVWSLESIPAATKNIYEQQYQIGLFIKEFYEGDKVALNDIGLVNYLADIKCFDVWGLGNTAIIKALKVNNWHPIGRLRYELAESNMIKIAILNETEEIPKKWIKVGEWRILDNEVCAGDTISFYVVDTKEKEKLISNLRVFSSRLPIGVVQNGEYLFRN